MSKVKPIAKVTHLKLGKHKAWGLADAGNKTVEIDERLTGYRHLLILIHEHIHIIHPDWSESKVIKYARKYARFIWDNNYRWVEIK